jgi:molecular chaperone GrpE (heat shock protein)
MYLKALPAFRNPFEIFLQHHNIGKTFEAQNKLKQASENYLKALKSLDNVKRKHYEQEEETRYHIAKATTDKLLDISEFYIKTYPNKDKSELAYEKFKALVY